jgi:FKBP-type peptidyl-prolyl cis-trans isomerase SlyD
MRKQKPRVMKDKVVSFHYTLKNENGEVLESSREQGPVTYLHGRRNIVEGLERSMNGRYIGETATIVVPPELGYGPYRPEFVLEIARPEGREVAVGDTITLRGSREAKVLAVTETHVTVDANHPLCRTTLTFDVEITAIRSATPEELRHQHAHADGHCSH